MTEVLSVPDRGEFGNQILDRIARIIDPAAFSPSDVIQINPSYSQISALRKADEIMTLFQGSAQDV